FGTSCPSAAQDDSVANCRQLPSVHLSQHLQVFPRDVADRDVRQAVRAPLVNRDLWRAAEAGERLENEEGDPVRAFADKKVGAGTAVPEDDASADEAKRSGREIGNVDRERHASLEPRL